MTTKKQTKTAEVIEKKQWYQHSCLLTIIVIVGIVILFVFIVNMANKPSDQSATESTQPVETAQTDAEHNAQAAKSAEEAKKTAEAKLATLKATAQNIPFKTLYRNIGDYTGKPVHYQGEVVQIIQDTVGGVPFNKMRVNITKGEYGLWEDTVLVTELQVSTAPSHSKILEKDIIDLWGTVTGEESYTSTVGAPVSLPKINAEIIELVK